MLQAVQFVSSYEPISVRLASDEKLPEEKGSILFIGGGTGKLGILFRDPAGTGEVGVIMFGPQHHWNGSVEAPTVTGCVKRGDWYGHLRNGKWHKALH